MSVTDWCDLAADGAGGQPDITADICVVGAGAAGCYLAQALSRNGLDTVVLEAGGESATSAEAFGFEPAMTGALYRGATDGRFFGLGGSTAHWGGALIPHGSADLRPGERFADEWRLIAAVAGQHATAVLQRLGASNGAEFETTAQDILGPYAAGVVAAGLAPQATLYLPFAKKNLRWLLPRRGPLRMVTNAAAAGWVTSEHGKGANEIAAVQAVSKTGASLTVRARHFVIAAGAIESARILLEIDAAGERAVIRPGAATGRYLSDHLSVAIGDFPPEGADIIRAVFAPRFEGRWMRSLRFVDPQPAPGQPRAFAHMVFHPSSPGFALVREVLRAMQARRLPDIRPAEVLRGGGDLFAIAAARLFRRRLHMPSATPVQLQLDIEQSPDIANGIELGTERDRLGRRAVRLHWSISDADRAHIRGSAARLLAHWPVTLPRPLPRCEGTDPINPHDAYHPAGTCRMGSDAEAVVDSDLRVHGVRNLWSVSTGILPSAGTANPTFTMLCFADRLAGKLLEAMRDA